MPFADDTKESRREKYLLIRAAIKEAAENENNINFGLLDIKEVPIEFSAGCANQILVLYSNGRADLLPAGVCGNFIRPYLGIRFNRIIKWGAMIHFSKLAVSPSALGVNKTSKDIYEC